MGYQGPTNQNRYNLHQPTFQTIFLAFIIGIYIWIICQLLSLILRWKMIPGHINARYMINDVNMSHLSVFRIFLEAFIMFSNMKQGI